MVEEYYSRVKKVLTIVLIINCFTGLMKVLYGYNSHILSITADGYDSLLDAASNIVGIGAITVSAKPSDKEHMYGHHKYETFASILISFTLFLVSYEIITSAIERFTGNITPSINIATYIVMIITLLITICASVYEKKMAKELNSNLLLSDSEHIKSDALATTIIILSLIFIQFGYTILDPILSVIIALLIIKTGLSILWSNINILLDKNMLPTDDIKKLVKTIYGVENVHNVRTRGTSSNTFLDMHIVVSNNLSLEHAHQISHCCENTIRSKYPEVKDVLIHIEPEKGIYDEIHYN